MSKRLGLLVFVCFAALFLALNHAAYRGYFQADTLDNLAWVPRVPLARFGETLLSPRFQPDNFRPVGHFYFYLAERLFGLSFPPWLALLQADHLLNVALLWLLARRLGSPPLAAGAACLFFGLHMALLDAVWKPMFAFDVICGTFCLLSVLFYLERRWLLAFGAYWLAYKSKELAVMLPLALAAAELWFGKGEWKRRWLPLAPFFLVSLSFGLQGLLLNPNVNNAYSFHFTPAAAAEAGIFYAGRVFFAPYAGFALPLAALVWRRPRVWLGLAAMGCFLVPLLFLPGRLLPAYCYVPFLGLALAFSGVAESAPLAALAAFFLLWAPVDLYQLRREGRPTLALDTQIHEWVSGVVRLAGVGARPGAVVYEGRVDGFADWGARGAIHYAFRDPALEVYYRDEPGAAAALDRPNAVLLSWNNASHRLLVRRRAPGMPASYLRMDGAEPLGQLGDGWYAPQGDYRWTAVHAFAELGRPPGATRFELRVQVVPAQFQALQAVTVRVALDGRDLDPHTFTRSGWQAAVWNLPEAPGGPVQVTITVSPPFQAPPDVRLLGLAVGGLGFSAPGPR